MKLRLEPQTTLILVVSIMFGGLINIPIRRAAVCRYRTPAGRIRIDELLAGPAANPARERTGMDTKGGGLLYNSSPPSAEWKSEPQRRNIHDEGNRSFYCVAYTGSIPIGGSRHWGQLSGPA